METRVRKAERGPTKWHIVSRAAAKRVGRCRHHPRPNATAGSEEHLIRARGGPTRPFGGGWSSYALRSNLTKDHRVECLGVTADREGLRRGSKPKQRSGAGLPECNVSKKSGPGSRACKCMRARSALIFLKGGGGDSKPWHLFKGHRRGAEKSARTIFSIAFLSF